MLRRPTSLSHFSTLGDGLNSLFQVLDDKRRTRLQEEIFDDRSDGEECYKRSLYSEVEPLASWPVVTEDGISWLAEC